MPSLWRLEARLGSRVVFPFRKPTRQEPEGDVTPRREFGHRIQEGKLTTKGTRVGCLQTRPC